MFHFLFLGPFYSQISITKNGFEYQQSQISNLFPSQQSNIE